MTNATTQIRFVIAYPPLKEVETKPIKPQNIGSSGWFASN
jgi:hypothetical protein